MLFTNAVKDGKPSGGSWFDSTVDLMNENMVYGSNIFLNGSDGTTIPYNYRVSKSQFPLFMFRPDYIMIPSRQWYWLRDIVSAARFANVNNDGYASCSDASYACGVRPAFALV
jgi:hypothetical protein